jgi:hypothetical protein
METTDDESDGEECYHALVPTITEQELDKQFTQLFENLKANLIVRMPIGHVKCEETFDVIYDDEVFTMYIDKYYSIASNSVKWIPNFYKIQIKFSTISMTILYFMRWNEGDIERCEGCKEDKGCEGSGIYKLMIAKVILNDYLETDDDETYQHAIYEDAEELIKYIISLRDMLLITDNIANNARVLQHISFVPKFNDYINIIENTQ